MMRKPRDLNNYVPAAEVAEGLRRAAATIERQAEIHPLVKIHLTLSYWNPDWVEQRGGVVTRSQHYKTAKASPPSARKGLNDAV